MSGETFISEKEKLTEKITTLFEEPFEFCVNYSRLVEEYVRKAASEITDGIAVVATGSFCRRELSPLSDIDIMFLAEENLSEDKLVRIKALLSNLWSEGIEASHTVRAFSDIDKFYEEDLHSFTQFFETRFLAGDRALYENFKLAVKEKLRGEGKERILEQLLDEVERKNKKYGVSPKVLQPNVKYSAGGLRDLHLAEWIYIVEKNEFLVTQKEITQTENFTDLLSETGEFGSYEIVKIKESYRFILGVRNLLHLINKGSRDRLSFELQEELADILKNYGGDWQKLMSDYFSASTSLHRFLNTLIKKCRTKEVEQLADFLSVDIDDNLRIFNGMLYCNKNCPLTVETIVRVFYYRGRYDALIAPALRMKIIESVEKEESSYKAAYASTPFFREIFNLENNVGKTLRSMNEIGVLGLIIPEFQDLIGFMQPGVYHAYTADEHTLIAIEKLEELKELHTPMAKLFHAIEDKDVLFLSAFFHDIAKPVNVEGHEIIGADMADSIMTRMGFGRGKIEGVRFLVRHHLTMEQIAFRRNLNDPVILDEFAAIFPNVRMLEYLYLLTYADLSAVNPRVWTQWKSELLYELFRKTHKILTEKISAEDLLHSRKKKFEKKILKEKKPEIKEHLSLIDDNAYVETFTREEIETHVNEIQKGKDVSVLVKDAGDYTNVTVITRDSSNLLSRLCGAFAVSDANIHDAKIFTRYDGIVIDTFNVSDFVTNKKIAPEKYDALERKIREAVQRRLLIAKEFKLIRSRWKRFEKRFLRRKKKPTVNFIEHENFTIIEVHSPDRLGLLYKITNTLNLLSLDVYFAKIVTHGNDVVDSFYTLMNTKVKVPENYYELIRQQLTETIENFLED